MIVACPRPEQVSIDAARYHGVDTKDSEPQGSRVTNTPDAVTGNMADLGIVIPTWRLHGKMGAGTWDRSET